MTSAPEVEANLAMARGLLERARAEGATLAALPENFAIMGRKEKDKVAVAETPGEGPIQAFLGHCARELGLWIIGGTIPLRVENEPERVAAASVVFDDHGRSVGRYDKIHMFDVGIPNRDAPQRNERYRESTTVAPGGQPQVVPTPYGRIGMAVCYDVRFPALYRALAESGASFLTVPSAFTRKTGEAHWHILLRSRAIETGCFVFAAAQAGTHENKRETYGHSLIIDPWGEILAEGDVEPGIIMAKIDPAKVETARRAIPSLQHGRRFGVADAKAGPDHLHLVRGSA